MTKFFTKQLLVVAFLCGSIWPASALTLGLNTTTPTIESSFAFIDFFDFDPDGDLSTFGALVDFTDGVSPAGDAEIGFGIGFLLTDPTSDFSGGFDIIDENGEFLSGDLIAVGFTQDVIELQFGNLGGSAVGSFGSSVLAQIFFDDQLGNNPFAALFEGDSLGALISISNVAAVPLPPSLVLFLTSLLGLGWFSRRRKLSNNNS